MPLVDITRTSIEHRCPICGYGFWEVLFSDEKGETPPSKDRYCPDNPEQLLARVQTITEKVGKAGTIDA